MHSTLPAAVRLRSALLWCGVTAATGALVPVGISTVGTVQAGGRPEFAELLTVGCAAAMLLAAVWLWGITTDVALRVLVAGAGPSARHGPVRMVLLAACGVVALNATAAPAGADDRSPTGEHSLAGLPLPDRATGKTPRPAPEQHGPKVVVPVRAGDSLWTIAQERLGPRATVADLVDYWHRIHERNAAVIGADPDLILPGQRLALPALEPAPPSVKPTRGGTR